MKKTIKISITTLMTGICISIANAQNSNSNHPGADILRFDGFYNTYDTSEMLRNYFRIHQLVLLKNQKVFYDNRGVSNELRLYNSEYYRRYAGKLMGTYRIVKDTLYATIISIFYGRGNRMKFVAANYIGHIKNADTILNWKMVPPYPNVNIQWNDYFKTDTAPKLMYFIKNDEIKKLQDIADKKEKCHRK